MTLPACAASAAGGGHDPRACVRPRVALPGIRSSRPWAGAAANTFSRSAKRCTRGPMTHTPNIRSGPSWPAANEGAPFAPVLDLARVNARLALYRPEPLSTWISIAAFPARSASPGTRVASGPCPCRSGPPTGGSCGEWGTRGTAMSTSLRPQASSSSPAATKAMPFLWKRKPGLLVVHLIAALPAFAVNGSVFGRGEHEQGPGARPLRSGHQTVSGSSLCRPVAFVRGPTPPRIAGTGRIPGPSRWCRALVRRTFPAGEDDAAICREQAVRLLPGGTDPVVEASQGWHQA